MIPTHTGGLEPIGFDNLKIAEVRDNVDPTGAGRLKVYVPEIQEDDNWNKEPNEFDNLETPIEKIKNKDPYEVEDYGDANYFWARSVQPIESNIPSWSYNHRSTNGGHYKIPRIGQKIFIFFQDGDPNKPFWIPWHPTMDEETMTPLFTSSPNWNDPNKKPNIDLLAYWNGNFIEMDTNENNNSLTISVVDDPANKSGPIQGDGQYKIQLIHSDMQGRREINLRTPSGHNITMNDATGDITIHSSGNIHMTANGTITANGIRVARDNDPTTAPANVIATI